LILSEESLSPALRASLYWLGILEETEGSAPKALGWLQALWALGADHLPLGLTHDLGFLLLRGEAVRMYSSRHLGDWTREERVQRLRYEDSLLGRWLLDEGIKTASLIIRALPEKLREAALIHAIDLILTKPLLALELPEGNTALLRREGAGWLEPISDLPWEMELDPAWKKFAGESLERCIEPLKGSPLRERDLWELEHFAELPSESARLALRQLHALKESVGSISRARAIQMERRAEIPSTNEESGEFPAGGFNALSTRGRMENLVRSEIAYVDAPLGELPFDLFDLRFLLGELLYYTRDESPLLDAQRNFTFLIDRPSTFRQKQPEFPAQDLLLLEGFLLALKADLESIFGPSALKMLWIWRCVDVEDEGVAQEEMRLLSLSLSAELAHRRLRLELLREEEFPARALVISPNLPPRGPRLGPWLRIEGSSWRLSQNGKWSELEVLKPRLLLDALLEALLKPREQR